MKQAFQASARALHTLASDIVDGFCEVVHNGFALIGLVLVLAVIMLLVRPDLRQAGEQQLAVWLEARKPIPAAVPAPEVAAINVIERTTAASPENLPRQQAAVAFWLSRKYRVAVEPLSVLVAEAYEIGRKTRLDPTLILAIMAIESSFNPFAQSDMGAQGLMQVMTRVHSEKYHSSGGSLAAFDPLTNMRVGVKVLQECIARAGSLEGGLRYYVGAAGLEDDGGYASKVLAEHARLQQVASNGAAPVLRSARVRPEPSPEVPARLSLGQSQQVAQLAGS